MRTQDLGTISSHPCSRQGSMQVSLIHNKRGGDYSQWRKRGPDKGIRLRITTKRRRGMEVPVRLSSYPLWDANHVNLTTTRYGSYVDNRGQIHSYVGRIKRPRMGMTTPTGNSTETRETLDTYDVHGQRSCPETLQGPSIPPPDKAHPTSIPLYSTRSGQSVSHNPTSPREGEPSRYIHQTTTNEYSETVEGFLDEIED